MVRSASAIIVAVAAFGLPGCVTTQRSSERLKLRADRTLAARKPVLVRTTGVDVRVLRVAVVRARRGGAIVTELANRTTRALSDVPITVGVGRTILNARAGLGFFQTHVAALPARGHVIWVFTAHRRIPRGWAFARAGDAARSPASLPRVEATLRGGRARLHNATAIPQYGLPVYAVARRGARYVAAGAATLDLGSRASAAVAIPVVGAARGAAIELEALPTIYR